MEIAEIRYLNLSDYDLVLTHTSEHKHCNQSSGWMETGRFY